MPTLLIRNARLLVTRDDQRREIADGTVLVRDQVIEAVGASADLPASADEVIDAQDQRLLPGLVNTHHPMVQTLTRAVPTVQDPPAEPLRGIRLDGWTRRGPPAPVLSWPPFAGPACCAAPGPTLEPTMPGLLPDVDPDGLLEYSVVYTDRALNHMSAKFQRVMRDISGLLKEAYHAHSAIVVPGSGTFGMEAVARQFATGKKCLVLRNGWFSYRWTQIFDMGQIPAQSTVLKARRVTNTHQAAFAPAPVDEVVATILAQKPDLVFAPHVETAAGLILPDDYLRQVAAAVHAVGGLLVLDCIASGAIWVDMAATGVDVLVSAPQKGWSGPPCCALVMLSELARGRIDATTSSSFACDLKKWLQIMETYEAGGHAYHATLPTDALTQVRDAMQQTRARGFEATRAQQQALGNAVRALMVSKGFASVAAAGFQAPGVVVSYTDDAGLSSGKTFLGLGLQTAAGVPLQCDEPADFKTFRIGLFGLDKLADVAGTVARLAAALDQVTSEVSAQRPSAPSPTRGKAGMGVKLPEPS